MTILTLADLEGSFRQNIQFTKTYSGNNQSAFSSYWIATGLPSAGAYAIGNTSNGVVPTDATTGAIDIAFGTGTGYVTYVEFTALTAARLFLYDRLFHAGSYSFNASTTLTSQPSFSSRVPGTTDYKGTQIWIECATNFTGSLSVAVTYSDQSGNTGHTTGTVSVGAITAGRLIQLPLASGDSGVSKIESVTGTVASAGTFNVLVLRPLWVGVADESNKTYTHPLEMVGMPIVYNDSCLFLVAQPSGASGFQPTSVDVQVEIASA